MNRCLYLNLKDGITFWTSSFHLSNFERIIGSMHMGPFVLDPNSAYARLDQFTHPRRTS